MILHKMIQIQGEIVCETGLRIGGSKDTIEIGGLDNPIVRHPIDDLPYIPGSSIKGKLRSLLESVHGRRRWDRRQRRPINDNGKDPCGCGQCMVCRIFGSHNNPGHPLGPTRLLVRDAKLTESSKEVLEKAQREKGLFFSEVKTENTINRRTGKAYNPRPYERVPEGTRFQLDLLLKIYDTDNEEECIQFVKQGLDLLESDYLGSSGSRGYGKISFHDLQFIEKEIKKKKED